VVEVGFLPQEVPEAEWEPEWKILSLERVALRLLFFAILNLLFVEV